MLSVSGRLVDPFLKPLGLHRRNFYLPVRYRRVWREMLTCRANEVRGERGEGRGISIEGRAGRRA